MTPEQRDREKTIDEIAGRIRGFATLRYEIMRMADEVVELRLKMIEVQQKMNEAVTKAVECADRLFTPSLAEHGSDGELKHEYRTSPVDGKAIAESIAEHESPSKRRCSNCNQLGHNARTCTTPRGETVQELVGDTPGPIKGKKKRKVKPLSDERKAQLAETLKKARAARKPKKK